MIDKPQVSKELRDTDGDEFDYDGEKASISAHLTSPTSAKIGHFVVADDYRRQGLGSVLFEATLDVLADESVSYTTVGIQALDDGTEEDGVMEFLREYGFRHIESFEHYNWGCCVRAEGDTAYSR